ncbi:MAG: hypothetical protein JJU36_15275 [Phycisphaeraceae bacterium]|nr:hypothetical protein [Phycisphaeraceae bacterium]
MAKESTGPRLVMWLDSARQSIWAAAIKRLTGQINIVAMGGPRAADFAGLARESSAELCDDFRRMLIEFPAAVCLVATAERIEPSDLAEALEQGAAIWFIEPPMIGLDDVDAIFKTRRTGQSRNPATSGHLADRVMVLGVPAFLAARGWIEATDPMQAIDEPQMMELALFRRPGELSLFACLFDAWQTVIDLADVPDDIWAVWRPAAGESMAPSGGPTALRGMTGHLSAIGALPRKAMASIQVSDQHPAGWGRLHMIGTKATVMVGEQDYRLWTAEGELLDQRRPTGRHDFVELITRQLRHHLNRLRQVNRTQGYTPQDPPDSSSIQRDEPTKPHPGVVHDPSQSLTRPAASIRYRSILSCCHATLLSIRTRQPESPAKFLDNRS